VPARFLVLIPLKIERRVVRGVLDLRRPEAADWLAQVISRQEWRQNLPAFPSRPPIDTFRELLPTVLSQELGGTDFHRVVGLTLRNSVVAGSRVGGLIFPSARIDSHLSICDGRVASASGWNLVIYGEDPPPRTFCVDHRVGWADVVRLTRSRPDEAPIRYDDVVLEFTDTGPERGSWKVTGLTTLANATFRIGQALQILEARSDVLPKNVRDCLIGWIFMRDREWAGRTSTLVYQALWGEPDSRARIAGVVSIEEKESGETKLVQALRTLLAACSPEPAGLKLPMMIYSADRTENVTPTG